MYCECLLTQIEIWKVGLSDTCVKIVHVESLFRLSWVAKDLHKTVLLHIGFVTTNIIFDSGLVLACAAGLILLTWHMMCLVISLRHQAILACCLGAPAPATPPP